MAFYLSPLVAVNEIDLSTTIPAVATSIGVTILRNTYKGPERKKWLITSTNDLINTFGQPTNVANCYQDILSATGFLAYGNALYCTRSMPVSATFAGARAVSGSEVTFNPFASAYRLDNVAGTTDDPDQFAEENTVTGNDPFWVIAAYRGASGNKIRLAVIDQTTYTEIASGGHSNWTTYSALHGVDSPLLTDKDFLIVVQECQQNQDSTIQNNWSTVETWNVSTNESELNDQGSVIFAETTINSSSAYIRIALNPTQKNAPITISTSAWQVLTDGLDNNGDTLQDGQIEQDLDLYSNAEEIDVNIFIDSNKSDTVKGYIDSICQARKDCMATVDVPYAMVVNNTGAEATDLRNWRNNTLNLNSSYSAIYANWLEVYDKWNAKYRWIPASGHVAGVYVNTDNVSDPWFAPAGLNRAILGNVRRLAWNPNQAERDLLYKAGLNPIVSFSGQGKVVFGQKTQLAKDSAFNRVNVRRLFITMEKAISTATKFFLFEPNDDMTRLLLVNMIDPFLRDVRSRRGIYDYMVICDETNNTPERIDRNELWCDIYIKPVKAAEFIVLNFIATKTGASFTELAGASPVA